MTTLPAESSADRAKRIDELWKKVGDPEPGGCMHPWGSSVGPDGLCNHHREDPGAPTTRSHSDRCGECRLGLGKHNLADPLCEVRQRDVEEIVRRAAKVMHAEACCPCGSNGCNVEEIPELAHARALQAAGALADPGVVDTIEQLRARVVLAEQRTSIAEQQPAPAAVVVDSESAVRELKTRRWAYRDLGPSLRSAHTEHEYDYACALCRPDLDDGYAKIVDAVLEAGVNHG